MSGKKSARRGLPRPPTAGVRPDAGQEALRRATQCHLAGDLAQAETHYRAALPSPGADGHALHGLGVIAFQRGAFSAARQFLQQAIGRQPHLALFHFNLAKTCAALDDLAAAAEAYRQALGLDPRHLPSLENLGKLLARADRNREAVPYLQAALSLQPANAGLRRALAMALWRASNYHDAVAVYGPVATAPIDRLKLAIMATATIDSRAEIDAAHARLRQTIAALESEVPFAGDPEQEMNLTCFHPAYHDGDLRDLMAGLGRLLVRAFPSLNWVAPHCAPGASRPARAKPRVGFLSAYFREHSVSQYFSGIVRGIDRHAVELRVFTLPSPADDAIASAIRAAADQYVVLAGNLAAMREQVAAAELDLLVYVDLGMHPSTYLLAFSRLAPIQVCTYGHPLTSGVPTIDCFVSHAGVEREHAAGDYSENLVLLPADSTFAHFAPPTVVPASLGRRDFGLPDGVPLYLCTQHLVKVHPDFDQVLRNLLAGDPAAIVVFVADQFGWQARLAARLVGSLGDLAGRVIFLPHQAKAESYFALYRLCDAALDTPHFGGGVTSFHALAMSVPVVTLPGATFRSRQTYALYRRMGLDDCVARDPDDYVAIARRLARDAGFAATVRAEIAARNRLIFDDPATVAAWNRALAVLLGSAGAA